MDRDDERTVDDAAAEGIEDKHPARPEQGDDGGFAEGTDQEPDSPEEQLEPNYARGIAHEDAPASERHGRFSEGAEQRPDSPEKDIERRFSEGSERSPTSE